MLNFEGKKNIESTENLDESLSIDSLVNEQFKSWKESFKSHERGESEIDDFFWEMLIEKGNQIDYGKEAVIIEPCQIDDLKNEALDIPEAMNVVSEIEKNLKDGPIVRLLKIYRAGKAEKEIQVQDKAEKILADSPVSDWISVPKIRPVDRRSLKLHNPELFKRMYKMGGDEVEFVVMDKVEGVDLATFAFQETLIKYLSESELGDSGLQNIIKKVIDYKLINNARYELARDKQVEVRLMKAAASIRSMGFENLEGLAKTVSSMPNPKFKELFIRVFGLESELDILNDSDYQNKIREYIKSIKDPLLLETLLASEFGISTNSQISDRERTAKFYEVIKEQIGFKSILPEDLLEAFRQAVELLHKNGIYHRDLHSRNVMIGDDGRLYLIDYGKSIVSGGEEDPYREDNESVYADDSSLSTHPQGLLYLLTQPKNSN